MTTDAALPTCARHPDRETRLACPRCGRPTCDLCLSASDGVRICQICRAEAGPDATPAAPVRRRAQARAPVTMVLLAIFVAVYALGTLTGDLASPLLNDTAQINELVAAGQWWRGVTATVVHSGIPHLVFNGYALYVLGAQLERGVGSAAFAALYLASALAGGIAFLVAEPRQVAVGASGAIFG